MVYFATRYCREGNGAAHTIKCILGAEKTYNKQENLTILFRSNHNIKHILLAIDSMIWYSYCPFDHLGWMILLHFQLWICEIDVMFAYNYSFLGIDFMVYKYKVQHVSYSVIWEKKLHQQLQYFILVIYIIHIDLHR